MDALILGKTFEFIQVSNIKTIGAQANCGMTYLCGIEGLKTVHGEQFCLENTDNGWKTNKPQ